MRLALQRQPTAWQRAVLVVASTLVALLAAEVLARLFDTGQPRFGQQVLVREVPTRIVDGVALWSEQDPRCDEADIRRAAEWEGHRLDAGIATVGGHR